MTKGPSNHPGQQNIGGKKYWLDDMRNVHKIFWALVVVCALLFLADAFYHKHVHFGFENWFGFFGLFGFIGSFLLVLVAREMRKFLMRDEDYYDR
ncbi:MAG: hypothetical protein AAF495_16750 [Pseudomonadota bacterium]